MNDSRYQSHLQPAFTLVEILVTIAVIAIAIGLGGGLYLGSYQRLQVDKAARQLYMTARYARLLALERQRSVRLCVDQKKGRFFLRTWQEDRSGQVHDTVVRDAVCRPVELTKAVQLEAVTIKTHVYDQGASNSPGSTEDPNTAEQTVTFRPDGTANAALLQVGNTHGHYTVSVNPFTAQVRLIKGTADKVHSTTVDLDQESTS